MKAICIKHVTAYDKRELFTVGVEYNVESVPNLGLRVCDNYGIWRSVENFPEYLQVELVEVKGKQDERLSSQMYQAGLIEGKRQAEDFAKHVYVSLTDYINDCGDLKTFAELKREHEQALNAEPK